MALGIDKVCVCMDGVVAAQQLWHRYLLQSCERLEMVVGASRHRERWCFPCLPTVCRAHGFAMLEFLASEEFRV